MTHCGWGFHQLIVNEIIIDSCLKWFGTSHNVEAALAAGIFHREEVPIEAVKKHMRERGIVTR